MAYDKIVDSAVLDANITTVADAIREKTGGTDALTFPAGMAEAIAGITGGEDLDDVLTEQGELIDDIYNELIESGVKMKQAKSATPALETVEVVPDDGHLLNKVTIAPITAELLNTLDADFKAENINEGVEILGVTGTLLGRKPEQAVTVTPSLEDQTISPDAGHAISGVTVGAVNAELLASLDADFVADNIAEGVNMFGVTGTLDRRLPEQAISVTPSLLQQTIAPDAGYVINGVTVAPVTAALLSSLDKDFVAANIAEGVEMFGVTGTLVGGGMKFDIVTASSMPAAVVNNRIVVLTPTTPTNIFVSSFAPAEPVEGDIWVKIGESTYGVMQTVKGVNVTVTFTDAKQYNGTEWVSKWAYVGMSDAWEKFSAAGAGTPLAEWPWSEIVALANSGEDATQYFAVGDEKELTLTTGEVVTAVIGDFYHNTITGTNTKAAFAFTFKDCPNTKYSINSTSTNADGWDGSNMRKTHMPAVLDTFPAELKANGAVKYVDVAATTGGSTTLKISSDRLRLHSVTELGLSYDYAGVEGVEYPYYTTENCIKTANGTAVSYWLRSPHTVNNISFCYVNSTGMAGSTNANGTNCIACAFDI